MTIFDRVLADSKDRPAWEAAREGRIGASDAANFAYTEAQKPGSRERYARQLLTPSFGGNSHTDVGNNWEQAALAAVGWEQSTLMFASEHEDGFAATPDGVRVMPDGRVRLAETKSTRNVKLDAVDRLVVLPPAHRRQIAWAAMVCGAYETDYVVNPIGENGKPLELEPFVRTVPRDEALIAHLLEIGTHVLPIYRNALEIERNRGLAW